ncbi:MAG: hypothetical protein D6718_12090 [Acidobacteria bacterium]|nr:MAG: hypothetical protein D6718_12090 [Acidobacteriota bacterium]
MCTLSFVDRPEGFELFFNRDERRDRKAALPPSVHPGPLRFLAPIDGESGGTWIAVNEAGLVLCLLNHYEGTEGAVESGLESRGRLVVALAACRSAAEAAGAVTEGVARRFRPFRLVLFQHGSPPLMVLYDGRGVARSTLAWDAEPVVSSSVDPAGVTLSRRRLFRRLGPSGRRDPNRLFEYHRSHEPEIGPYSVCMHRPDARTVSLTRVSVERDVARMWYAPGPPCRTELGPPRTLPLRRLPQASPRGA